MPVLQALLKEPVKDIQISYAVAETFAGRCKPQAGEGGAWY